MLACMARLNNVHTHAYMHTAAALFPFACRSPGDPSPADPKEEVFLAFGRVYCGVAREGQRVSVQGGGQMHMILIMPLVLHMYLTMYTSTAQP